MRKSIHACILHVHTPVSISAVEQYDLLFDYSGFPPESYKFKYQAKGSPTLAHQVSELLFTAGIESRKDIKRGLDHGAFVPLMLMYPKADIPVVVMSLHKSMDTALHIAMGKAVSILRNQGVLIIGSGASFHNFEYFFAPDSSPKQAEGIHHSQIWDSFLIDTLTSTNVKKDEREKRLETWDKACLSGRPSHPQEEHLLPLHVIAGAADLGLARKVGAEFKTVSQDGMLARSDDMLFSNFEFV